MIDTAPAPTKVLEELAQDGHGVQARRPKPERVPSLFGGAQPRPLRSLMDEITSCESGEPHLR